MLQTGLLNAVSFKEASMWKETISVAFVLCLLRCEDPGFSVQHAKALQGIFYELVCVCVCVCVCVSTRLNSFRIRIRIRIRIRKVFTAK